MDTSTFSTQISPRLIDQSISRGLPKAALGVLILFIAIFFPLPILSRFGGALFFISYSLILVGFTSYRTLKMLELSPHTLLLKGDQVTYRQKKQAVLSFSLKDVDHLEWVMEKERYGILFFIKDSALNPLSPKAKRLKKEKGTLFLPFFTKSTCLALKEAKKNRLQAHLDNIMHLQQADNAPLSEHR